jgi:hypothetical protein
VHAKAKLASRVLKNAERFSDALLVTFGIRLDAFVSPSEHLDRMPKR